MSQALLNKTTFVLRLRRGLRSLVERYDVFGLEGEIGCTTDDYNLWIADSTYAFRPVQTLDLLVSFDDQAVFHNDAAVFHI